MSTTTLPSPFDDLPRLVDPQAGTPVASADSPGAQRLLTALQAQAGPVAGVPGRRPHRSRRLVAMVAAVAAIVGLLTFVLPFGGGTPAAEALQQATDLLRASVSGRAEAVTTEVLNGQEATSTSLWEWNGDNSHGRTDYVGSFEEQLADFFTVFTPDSFETYNVDSTVLMSIDDAPFRPATDFGPSPQQGALERFERLIGAVEGLGQCDSSFALTSPIEGADVTSYCGSGSGAELYSQVASDSMSEVLSAGDVLVRVDVDNVTGIVAALRVEAVDVVLRPWAPPSVDVGDLELGFDRVADEVTWRDLGQDIQIVLPPTG